MATLEMLSGVDGAELLKLRVIARSSENADVALPHAIRALVGHENKEKIQMIVTAIQNDEALYEQWISAWSELRNRK